MEHRRDELQDYIRKATNGGKVKSGDVVIIPVERVLSGNGEEHECYIKVARVLDVTEDSVLLEDISKYTVDPKSSEPTYRTSMKYPQYKVPLSYFALPLEQELELYESLKQLYDKLK